MKHHPPELIAKVKALLDEGVPRKVIARWTGLSPNTMNSWRCASVRVSIAPDGAIVQSIKMALREGWDSPKTE